MSMEKGDHRAPRLWPGTSPRLAASNRLREVRKKLKTSGLRLRTRARAEKRERIRPLRRNLRRRGARSRYARAAHPAADQGAFTFHHIRDRSRDETSLHLLFHAHGVEARS